MTEPARRRITFILPCAGSGRRLRYAGHKELFPILPDLRLIDFSLEHIREAVRRVPDRPDWELSVAVVIQPWKTEVSDYVARALTGIRIFPVLFDAALHEWPGSVHSARFHYGDINVVLLPDSRLALSPDNMTCDPDGKCLVERMIEPLRNHPVAFGYVPCTDSSVLARLGALHVTRAEPESMIVDRFQDKPDMDLARYNGYWCCYGFRAGAGESLYRFLYRSVLHEPADILSEAFHPAAAFPVDQYMDLGTPESVARFRERLWSV